MEPLVVVFVCLCWDLAVLVVIANDRVTRVFFKVSLSLVV